MCFGKEFLAIKVLIRPTANHYSTLFRKRVLKCLLRKGVINLNEYSIEAAVIFSTLSNIEGSSLAR